MKDVYALIMAGGSGERFWPKSRSAKPKQLLSIIGKDTMLQETVKRVSSKMPLSRILVVANQKHLGQIRRQLPRIKKENIIIEPLARNTASAIGLSALWVKEKNPEGIMVVLPSDHVIEDKTRFFSSISTAVSAAKSGNRLIAIGLIPRFAFSGYGYIKKGFKIVSVENKGSSLFEVNRFIEKPSQATAYKLFDSGKYLWNAGIFVWKAKDILKSIDKHMPELSKGLSAIEPKIGARNYLSTVKRVYEKIRSVSIDNGVLEKAKNVYVVASDLKWSDIGSWASMASFGNVDSAGNTAIGLHKAIDTKDSIIIGSDKHLIGTVGLSDVIIVHTEDATLVCKKDKAQKVRELVRELKQSRKLSKFA